MTDLNIYAEEARTEPKYRTTAAEILAACRAFYMDPENEKAYMESKEEKNKKIRRYGNTDGRA